MKIPNLYLALSIIVFGASFFAMIVFRQNPEVLAVLSLPVMASFIMFVSNFVMEELRSREGRYLKERDEVFRLGAAAHMANVVFDKHVAFCEEYIAAVHGAAEILFRHGPSRDAIEAANNLHRIRQKYAAWVSRENHESLEPFEKKVRAIGANAEYLKNIRDGGPAEAEKRHGQTVEEMYDLFREVLGVGENQNVITDSVAAVVELIRETLKISQLTDIRDDVVANAHERLAK